MLNLKLVEDMDYYEGLREGLRNACQLELTTWFLAETHESVFQIERHGQRLWTMRVIEIALMERGAVEEVKHQCREVADEIINKILDECDWDTFFDMDIPEEDKPEQHPYTAIRTIKDIPTGDHRKDWLN